MEYELELQAKLAVVHPVFHISLLIKCVGDPTSVVPLERMYQLRFVTTKMYPLEVTRRT